MDQNKVIDAANARAALYDSDDRQDIKVDVMNAFFAGAKFGARTVRVIVSPLIQPEAKIKLSDKCLCSPQVLNEFNAWLKEMFGEFEPLYFMQDGQTVVCGMKTAQTLRAVNKTNEVKP